MPAHPDERSAPGSCRDVPARLAGRVGSWYEARGQVGSAGEVIVPRMARRIADALGRAGEEVRLRLDLRRARADGRGPPRAEGIVFSKDRPLQLFALLASYAELVRDPPALHVLYRSSSDRYRAAYDEVLRLSPAPLGTVVAEREFREDLLALLAGVAAPRVFFLVDDIVVVREVELAPLLALDAGRFVPSLRLGEHLRRAYTVDREQPLPPFRRPPAGHPDLLCWRWKDGALDWGYPLSLDGHVFSTGEIRALARNLAFAAPNSFEAALQLHRRRFRGRLGVCFREARIMNVPCTRVQSEIDNRSGNVDPAELLAVWRSGRRLDHRRLYGIRNESAHQEVELAFVPREGPGAPGAASRRTS